jgi:hypothetical protein
MWWLVALLCVLFVGLWIALKFKYETDAHREWENFIKQENKGEDRRI